jgi:EAL and modified HD-GYP domain-containing signal transduction protein
MLQRLRQAFTRKTRTLEAIAYSAQVDTQLGVLDNAAATERLNTLAPIKPISATQTNQPEGLSFVNREAVLNRGERIAGYEFSLQGKLQSRFSAERAAVRRVYDDLLICSLALVGIDRILGHRLAIVDLAAAQVSARKFHGLPPQNTVLMLDPTPAEAAHPNAVVRALQIGRESGYRMGLRIRKLSSMPDAFDECDWIQIETPDFDGIDLSRLVNQLRSDKNRARSLSIVAANIATSDDFRHCFRLEIDYFQGPFVTSREKWEPPKSDIDRTRVILVLNKLRAGEENAKLAALMQEDPVMTYKFLRFINSAAMGLQTTVDSVARGLTLLGSSKFYRWLSLLLFDVKNPSYVERSLTEQALVRAHFMERFASQDVPADALFLTGLFSLLDAIMGQSIDAMLSKFTLLPAISDALLKGEGPLAPFLQLAILCEGGRSDQLELQATKCGLDLGRINSAQLDALAFANQITAAIEL